MRLPAAFHLLAVLKACLAEPEGTSLTQDCYAERHTKADEGFNLLRDAAWQSVESRRVLPSRHVWVEAAEHEVVKHFCKSGHWTARALANMQSGEADSHLQPHAFVLPSAGEHLLDLGISLYNMVMSGFPIFGIQAWRSQLCGSTEHGDGISLCIEQRCKDSKSMLHLKSMQQLVRDSTAWVPMLDILDYIQAQERLKYAQLERCHTGSATAYIALALKFAQPSANEDCIRDWLAKAEEHLRSFQSPCWACEVWLLLHLLQRRLFGMQGSVAPTSASRDGALVQHEHRRQGSTGRELRGCLILLFVSPTAEIIRDAAKALALMEKHYLQYLRVTYPLIVFTDAATAPYLSNLVGIHTSAPLVPAVIPDDELGRPMKSYMCIDGVYCHPVSDEDQVPSGRHRGNGSVEDEDQQDEERPHRNAQYWSAGYLRLSRYSAGPLWMHEVLADYDMFLKIDTDFFMTAPLEKDPLLVMAREGAQLAWWQAQIQGQRREGYVTAAAKFLQASGLMEPRNPSFDVRTALREQAADRNANIDEDSDILDMPTLVYGCLFGGSLALLRGHLYQAFFEHMANQGGFEEHAWSNQFFLGTVAIYFLYPSEVMRLLIPGRHQGAEIRLEGGNLTEFLLGSPLSVGR